MNDGVSRSRLTDTIVSFAICVFVASLTLVINSLRPADRESAILICALLIVPTCIALPQLGQYNVIASVFCCGSSLWIVHRYLSDWDAGVGVPGFILGIAAFVALLATVLSFGYSRGFQI